VIGGALLTVGSWRWLFLVNLPAGLIGVVTATTLLPRTRGQHAVGPVGLARVGRLITGALRAPRLPFVLLGSFAGYTLLFGTLVAIPLYLHERGASSALVGLIVAALPVVIGVVAPVGGHLADRAPHVVTRGGLATAVAALAAVAGLQPATGVLIGLLVAVGVGLGSFLPANNRAVMLAAPAGASGAAAGLLNMTRGLGTAAGTALAVMLVS
jgi:MFS family permease